MNNIDAYIFNYLKHTIKYSDKLIEKQMKDFERNLDIKAEFATTLKFGYPKQDPITIEGYTAEQLEAIGKLSILGAYNYLIYLREEPKDALRMIKKGLPRK